MRTLPAIAALCGFAALAIILSPSKAAAATAFGNDAADFDAGAPARRVANRTALPRGHRRARRLPTGHGGRRLEDPFSAISSKLSFEMRASCPDPFGWIVLHAAGTASWLKTEWGAMSFGGYDTPPAWQSSNSMKPGHRHSVRASEVQMIEQIKSINTQESINGQGVR